MSLQNYSSQAIDDRIVHLRSIDLSGTGCAGRTVLA